MRKKITREILIGEFTFQYGSTLISLIDAVKHVPLKFTFQYGSTLIKLSDLQEKWGTLFTFQYGSTLIYFILGYISQRIVIYIPIWFYFNVICPFQIIRCIKIYIPIWFYFNYVAAS